MQNFVVLGNGLKSLAMQDNEILENLSVKCNTIELQKQT